MADARLYPPVIGGTLPAFYSEGGTVVLTVPFHLNRAVSRSSIGGFSLKLKTVQGNLYLSDNIQILDNGKVQDYLGNLEVPFLLPREIVNRIKIGQFLKVQMAFKDYNGSVGYFSNVGIVKYTAKPELSIIGAETEDGKIPIFKRHYIGLYTQNKDVTEKVYQYIFNLYNNKQALIHSSGWLVHNSENDNADSNVNSLIRQSLDDYKFNVRIEPYQKYYLQYGVKTINGLEEMSRMYLIEDSEGTKPNLRADLIATADFTDGFIKLSLKPEKGTSSIEARGTYIILRNDITLGNASGWQEIKRFLMSPQIVLQQWDFKDFTVEQGRKYQYAIQQYGDNGIFSSKIISNSVECDFEDMFLYDGERQLKMRLDPKVASFKIDRLEQKIDTIGSKFPFFARNGVVEYKEFPISARISYLSDENQYFMKYKDLGLEETTSFYRVQTPTDFNPNEKHIPTTNKVGYNFFAEREFKLEVLNWLSNGKPKLFRSPGEGNYVVRLMNVSLTPDDKVQRLLHNFTATAYEIAEFDYDSLITLGFIDDSNPSPEYVSFKTESLANINSSQGMAKINTNNIEGYVQIKDFAPSTLNTDVKGFAGDYLIARDSKGKTSKIVIGPNGALQINTGSKLPDLYVPQGKSYQGQILYKYSAKAQNTFNLVQDISIMDQSSTFLTDKNELDVTADVVNNVKRETNVFTSLKFYPRQVINLYKYQNAYYLNSDCTKKALSFDPTKAYRILQGKTTGLKIEGYGVGTSDRKLKLVESINNTFYINGKKFIDKANIVFPPQEYKSIKIGNGIILDASYQTKVITYSVEDEDEILKQIKAKNPTKYEQDPRYLARLQQIIDEIQKKMERSS